MRRIHLPLHIIVAALFVFACNSHVFADGVVIKVTNTSDKAVTLSDLIVFSATGEKQTRLTPGDASDDIKIGAHKEQIIDLDFKPVTWVFSTKEGDSEPETKVFKFDVIAQGIKLLSNANNGAPLFLSIDYSLYTFTPPSDGTVFSVTNGLVAGFPGWFIGQSIDLGTGEISNPFTGDALVDSTLQVETVPEPTTLVLLGSGIAAVGIKLRRRKADSVK